MTSRSTPIAVALLVGALAAGGWLVSGAPLLPSLCDVTVHSRVASPDGKLSAIVHEHDCGATTPLNTQISVAPSGASFSADAFPPFLVVDGRHAIVPIWTDDDSILVRLPPDAEIYRRETVATGVSVVYR